MNELFKALAKAEQASNFTSDLQGRVFGLSLGVVANIDDPLSIGRVQVMLPSKGAKTTTDWLVRLSPSKTISAPLVDIGDVVLVGFINGDPSNGCYLGIINNIPQPPAKEIANTVLVNGETYIKQTAKTISLVTGQSSLTLTSDGTLDISGVSSVTINGKAVSTVGAVDSRGDSLTTKGWS